MFILLITFKTGVREWYSYETRGRLLNAKDVWKKDTDVLLVQPVTAIPIT